MIRSIVFENLCSSWMSSYSRTKENFWCEGIIYRSKMYYMVFESLKRNYWTLIHHRNIRRPLYHWTFDPLGFSRLNLWTYFALWFLAILTQNQDPCAKYRNTRRSGSARLAPVRPLLLALLGYMIKVLNNLNHFKLIKSN